jgi:signal transduction histidine kinase
MELTTLNKTSAAVVATLDSQQVIDNILNEVQRLLSVNQCALLVVNEETQQLELRASRGLSGDYPSKADLTDACQRLPACRAITSGKPIQVPDIETEPDFFPMLAVARKEGYRSILAIPLAAPHAPPAALAIYRADIHHFSEQEVDLVTSFANFAAIALEHATLFSLTDAELQKRVRFLSALNRVGRTVSQSLVIDDVLSNAMEAVFEVMPADACWIYLRRETEDFLRLRAQRGFPPSILEQVRRHSVEYGQGIIGKVAETNRPLLLEGGELQGDEWAKKLIAVRAEWQAVAAAPLLAQETVIGVLGMATRSEQSYTGAEVELLGAIGDQLAIAVVNARLYRRSREVATLEERNRVAREIHDTLAQGFTGILVQLQAAERLSLKHPERAVQSLQEARELARLSLQEARRSVLNLRPTALEHHTLDKVIAQEVERFDKDSGIKADFILEGYPSLLPATTEQNLYRITQEALTNIRRHAEASNTTVTLSFESGRVALTITDDGVGLNGSEFGGEQAFSKGTTDGQNGPVAVVNLPTGGFGLVGIQERVNLMKGQVTIESPPTGGTQIKVVIPK